MAETRGGGPLKHVHLSALHLIAFFVGVLVVGTLWRLIAFHLILADPTGVSGRYGRMMLLQY
jgi:hypothetical protein